MAEDVRTGEAWKRAARRVANIEAEFKKLRAALPVKTRAQVLEDFVGDLPVQRFSTEIGSQRTTVVNDLVWEGTVQEDELAAEIEAECERLAKTQK